MVRAFLQWWLRQLLDLLPARLRGGRDQASEDALLLSLTDTVRPGATASFDAVRRRGRREIALGRFSADEPGLQRLRAAIGPVRRTEVRVLLPPRMLLERDVTLPLAAERGLETALRWEMDKLTPFSADAVFWSWHVAARDRARSRIDLQLRLVPKSLVAPLLSRLATAGLPVGLLASAGAPGHTVPLDRHDADGRPGLGLLLGGALCASLVIAAIALPLVRQELAFRRLDERIGSLRPQVDLADGLRRRLADRAAGVDVLSAEAGRVGDTLRMLATVTDLLPDGTYLYGLTLRNRMLTISGESSAAAKLIPALAADPAVADPVFAAPVTRNEVTGTEAFTIRAELKR